MSDPVNLNAARMERSKNCKDWTVRDVLEKALKDLDAGVISPDMVYLCIREPGPDNTVDYWHLAAGVTNIEAVGLLAHHLNMAINA